MSYLYAVDPRKNIAETSDYHVFSLNGRNIIAGGDNVDVYKRKGLKILNGVQFYELYNKHRDQHAKKICDKWTKITEEEYNDALNKAPTKNFYDDGFFASECYTLDMAKFYQKWKGKFYSSLQKVKRPRVEIIDSLLRYIHKKK